MLASNVRPPVVALLGGEGLRSDSASLWQHMLRDFEPPRVAIISAALSAVPAPHAERRVMITKAVLEEMGMQTQLIEPADQSSDALTDVPIVYLPGGEALAVCQHLRESVIWQAIQAPNSPVRMLIASGGSAVALGQVAFGPIKPVPAQLEELSFDILPGLGLLKGIVILPYFSWLQDQVIHKIVSLSDGYILVGIDDQAALISRSHGWEVAGLGTVSIIRSGMSTAAFDSGAVIPTDVLPSYS